MKKDFFDIPIPYDEGAERAVLGSLIVYYPESDFILNILKPEDFYEERNRIVYETIIEIINEGHKINAQTIKLYLEKKGKLEEIGGLAYILELIEENLPIDALEPIVRDIKDKAVARGLIELAKRIIVKAKKIKDVNQLIEEAEAEIFRLNEERSVSEYYPISEIIQQVLQIINDLSKKDTIITGIPSGFYDLDKLTTGFHEGDLVIIAARPAMGKTSYALSILHNVSVVERLPSAFFSLEMSKEQIGMRLLSLESRIPLKNIRSGFIAEKDLEKITEVAMDIAKAPIYIDDTPSISILELRAKARRLKREKDIKLIVIDYLQLMRSHRRTENRQQEVAEISRGLKALAKELNIPVLALAQLSRQVENRSDKRPQLADLRESGSIEQDADLVMFIHRPEYYKKNPTPEEEGLAEIIIAKQRNGPTGTVKLAFIKDITKFENLTKLEDEEIEIIEAQEHTEDTILQNEDLFSSFEEEELFEEKEENKEEDEIDF